MIDLGISKLALIGVVALVVVGPERLPRLARTVGTLLGRAQRYVSEVKAEVSREIELEELRKMRTEVETAAADIEKTVGDEMRKHEDDFNEAWSDATSGLDGSSSSDGGNSIAPPVAKTTRKNWRVKQSAMPQWYKQRAGIRRNALSGAARVRRYRTPAGKAAGNKTFF
ncbi:MAG: Sec-independent protein translocase protein TatB [Candidatus Protistobacter heckmanni]|nr:Sec-independent protein translocase protein TatB [Candidatus Protistobacter heckmanni]